MNSVLDSQLHCEFVRKAAAGFHSILWRRKPTRCALGFSFERRIIEIILEWYNYFMFIYFCNYSNWSTWENAEDGSWRAHLCGGFAEPPVLQAVSRPVRRARLGAFCRPLWELRLRRRKMAQYLIYFYIQYIY